MAIAFDVLSKLTELSWRGLSAPASMIETAFEQSMAEHMRPGEDEARIESLGRNPLQVSATLHFRNAIFAAPGDSWKKKNIPLYPDQWTEFIDACAEASTGDLVHPILGTIKAKLVSFRSVLSADKRDGEDVNVVWRRTLEDDSAIFNNVFNYADVQSAAAALDTQISIMPVQVQAADPDGLIETFLEAVNKATTAVDQIDLAARQFGGVADRIVYRCEALMDACERVTSPQMWPAKNTINRMIEASRKMQREQLKKAKPTSIYINPKNQTIPMLAVFLNNKVGDIITLNPSLMGLDFVPVRQAVRFYTSSAR